MGSLLQERRQEQALCTYVFPAPDANSRHHWRAHIAAHAPLVCCGVAAPAPAMQLPRPFQQNPTERLGTSCRCTFARSTRPRVIHSIACYIPFHDGTCAAPCLRFDAGHGADDEPDATGQAGKWQLGTR